MKETKILESKANVYKQVLSLDLKADVVGADPLCSNDLTEVTVTSPASP